MKFKKRATCPISFLLLTISLMALFVACNQENIYRVYYVQFGWQSYGIMDENRIEKSAMYIFDVASPNIDQLFGDVSNDLIKKEKYDNTPDVRVKLIRKKDGKVIYTDKNKDIVSGEYIYSISKELTKKVVRDIAQKAKVSECRERDTLVCTIDVEYEVNLQRE